MPTGDQSYVIPTEHCWFSYVLQTNVANYYPLLQLYVIGNRLYKLSIWVSLENQILIRFLLGKCISRDNLWWIFSFGTCNMWSYLY